MSEPSSSSGAFASLLSGPDEPVSVKPSSRHQKAFSEPCRGSTTFSRQHLLSGRETSHPRERAADAQPSPGGQKRPFVGCPAPVSVQIHASLPAPRSSGARLPEFCVHREAFARSGAPSLSRKEPQSPRRVVACGPCGHCPHWFWLCPRRGAGQASSETIRVLHP